MTLCNGIDGLRHERGSRARGTRVGIRKRTMGRLRGGTATPVPPHRTPGASAVRTSKNANEKPLALLFELTFDGVVGLLALTRGRARGLFGWLPIRRGSL